MKTPMTLALTPLVWLSSSQEPAVRELGAPTETINAEFSAITGVRELSDGRLVVLDARERRLYVVNRSTRTATVIGREGSGPEEYAGPDAIFGLSGDTTLISDSRNSRYLLLSGAGKFVGALPRVRIQAPNNASYGVSVAATDTAGHFYFALPTGMLTDPERGAPVIRYDRRSARMDTVARLAAVPVTQVQVAASAGATAGPVFGGAAQIPFTPRDAWAVSADGRIGIARANPYRLDRVSASGQVTQGAPVSYTPVRVTEADKEEYRQQMRSQGGSSISIVGPSGQRTEQRLTVPEPASWPETKPPFAPGAMRLAPDGSIWVLRSSPSGAGRLTYDVFDRGGVRLYQVTTASKTAVVAIGRNAVFTAGRDADDVLHLQVHPLPR